MDRPEFLFEVVMSKEKLFSRRSAVKLGVQVPVAATAAVVLGACGEDEEVILCANPNSLSFSENSIRQANNFTEVSPHADMNCLNCAFFTQGVAEAEAIDPSCGHCSIFEGFANLAGYCDSWATKDTGQG